MSNETLEALPLSVNLAIPDKTRSRLKTFETAFDMVKDYTITDADTAAAVASEMNAYLRSIDELEVLRKKHIAPGLQVIQNAKDLFDPAINGLIAAKDFCKNLLSGWDVKERARVALENKNDFSEFLVCLTFQRIKERYL